jgi:hypothetical protein
MSVDELSVDKISSDEMTCCPFFKLVFKATPSLTSSTLKQFLQHFMFRAWGHFFQRNFAVKSSFTSRDGIHQTI